MIGTNAPTRADAKATQGTTSSKTPDAAAAITGTAPARSARHATEPNHAASTAARNTPLGRVRVSRPSTSPNTAARRVPGRWRTRSAMQRATTTMSVKRTSLCSRKTLIHNGGYAAAANPATAPTFGPASMRPRTTNSAHVAASSATRRSRAAPGDTPVAS